ncbi:MAG: GlcG/HbpS family heme-binding protein [Panacagrimonas sp.]
MNKQAIAVAQSVIHHQAAMRAVDAALAEAESLGINVCVAVVDSAGRLAAFARMPAAFLISGDIAIKKAHSTAAIGAPADMVEQALAQEAPRVREGIVLTGFSMIQGGLPIRFNEALIGAVGVSGGSEAQDVQCAQAAVAALS